MELRAKSGRTMVGGAAAGHRKFLHVWVARVRGKIIPAQVLGDLRGKGLCGKEAFLPTAFLVTFVATKVTALPRQLSGSMLSLLLNNVNTPAPASVFRCRLQACMPACKVLNMQIPDVYLSRGFVFLEAIGTH